MEINGRKFVEYQLRGGSNVTIRTIPHTVNLAAICLTCGVVREVDRDQLRPVSDLSLREVSPKLRCTLCDRKHAKLFTGYYGAAE